MANNSPTIVAASLDDEKLKKSIEQMVQNLNDGLKKMKESTDSAVDYMQKSLQKLGNVKFDSGGAADGGSSKRAKHQNEETDAVQKTTAARKEYNATLDQTAQAMQSAAAAGKKYSDEIIRQANAIREMKEWQEKGYAMVGERVYYDPERSSLSAKKKLSLEEQILNTQKEQEVETIRQAAAERQEVVEKAAAEQEARRQLAVETQITQEQTKRSQSKNFTSYDSLRDAIAHVLGLQQSQVKLADAETASYNNLDKTLKQLNQTYNRLTNAERNSEQGKALVASIHEVERAMQKIRSQAARPISLNSIIGINGKGGLSEKTLDDIAYKLRQLQSYKMGLDLNSSKATSEIRQIDNEINRLKKDMDKYMSTGREVNSMNNALARSFNYMKNRLAFYFTVGASTAFVKNIINIRGQYELLERSIGILFDSMQTGTKIFSELNAMAIKSPFTTMELGAAAKQLSAYNIAAKDVVDTTRRLADIAAAVGVPIERLTYALGQIKSYGYLNSRDARMFANAGIPLIQNLADMYTKLEGRLVSIGDVYDRIKHKQVSFEDTLKVVNEMTDEGGRFFNFQEKAADTLVVRLANLTLAWNNMMNELGKDNTGIINSTLGGLKTIFEHWRDIDAAIWGVVKILGIAKSAQFIWLMFVRKTGIELALLKTFGQKLGYTILGIATSLQALAANPLTWIAAAVVSLGYLYQKWSDLQEANEAFNKSISDGAKENIESINKFFDKYKKEIDSVGSAKSTDQEKMWERIREEIEKTTKNAQQYIDILEKIPNAAERVGRASGFLEQQQVLQQEAKRMADHGLFDMGGGFANDTLSKDLREYEKTMNDVLKKYGSLEEAQNDFKNSMIAWSSGHYAVKYYNEAVEEAEKELDNFTSILDKANLSRIMGEGSDEERLANIRSFAQLIRDNFLATEEGQKITTEGQARLNKEIDYWIAQQGVSKGLINETRAEVERNRSAWETFFSFLNADQKKALDYLVSTGQTTTNEFKKIWNDAATEMKASSKTAYEQIQEHIADLRKTAPIVINVVYRETKESKDEAQKDFEKRFTTPKVQEGLGRLAAEAYLAEQKRLNTIYGRFNKKTGEDMVEWEKRLGQEYQDNEKKLTDYNKMLEGYNNLSDEQKKKREAQINTVTKERDELKATQDALKEVQTWENFDFEQFKKGKKGGGSKKDFLGEAFAKVVEVTGNMQKRFKEYKQAGVDANTALEKSTQEYEKTLENANATLAKYGIKSTKSGNELAKMELRDLRTYYESLLTIAKGVNNTKGVESLEKAIASLNVEITKFDYKKITDGLNNELGRLKDEYELAVSLDADPELGGVFADMMGINTETLPRTVQEYADEYTKLLNKYLNDTNAGLTLPNLNLTNDDLRAFEQMVKDNKLNEEVYKNILKAVKEVREERKKDIDENIKSWNKLIEKYAEYESKMRNIEKTAAGERKDLVSKFGTDEERRTAVMLETRLAAEDDPEKRKTLSEQLGKLADDVSKRNTKAAQINVAIGNKETQERSGLNFEEFKKSGIWSVATGNLSGLTDNALGGLISSLERFKKTEKGLDGKKLKEIERVIRSLRKQQREGNPFLAIGNAMDEAKERAAELQPQMDEIMRKIVALDKKRESGNKLTDEEEKELKSLKQQWKDLWSTTEVSATEIVGFLNNCISYASQAVSMFTEMANALSGGKWNEGLEILNDVTSTIEKAGQGAAVGAQAGGLWGAIIGGVAGGIMGAITAFADNGNKKIDAKLKESEVAVKRLEAAYVDLQNAMDKAYGTGIVGSKRLLASMKELELAELERQLALEQSRSSKNRDEGTIADLQKQIKELRYEIEDTITEITNELLGGEAGSFAEGLVSSMIDAFKNGEDYMKVFEDKFDEMIDNMIMKSITSRVVAQYIDRIWDDMDARIKVRSTLQADELARATKRRQELESMDVYAYGEEKGVGKYGIDTVEDVRRALEEMYNTELAAAKEAENTAQKAYDAASTMDDSDISTLIAELAEIKPELGEKLREILGEYYKFGETSDKELSALQQGISQISEQTANALEAYANSISQQAYLRNDLLVQIRDTIMSFDMDVQLGVFSQMLLQLQNNYIIMQSMQSMMEGWTTPSGQGIRVELIS